MEERKAKVICYERRGRRDMISKLPDSLISQILLYLPTKEVVKTSVLSKRWKSVWLLIPELDLECYKFPDYNAFVGFMDKFLDFYREQNLCLDKLKLSIRKDKKDHSCVTRWIDFVATRKLKHLDVKYIYPMYLHVMPLSLYTCETLLCLRLRRVILGSFESVSLPCLKTMCLEKNVYENVTDMESLISSCPVLEDLSILRMLDDKVLVLRVYSQTITSLRVGFVPSFFGDYYSNRDTLELLIDAPRLMYLRFEHDHSPTKILSNLSSLVKVNIVGDVGNSYYSEYDLELSKHQMVRNFFTGLSKVREMSLSDMQLIYSYLKVEPLPQFCNLSSFEARVLFRQVEILEILPRLLESFPNLKSIVLDLFFRSVKSKQISVSFVPQCLLSSLEYVEIKSSTGYYGDHVAMEIAMFFAKNSVVLKKLVLSWKDYILEEDSVLRDLLALLRQPSTCQIEVCGPIKRLVSGSLEIRLGF